MSLTGTISVQKGLVSGIDTQAIIQEMLNVERRPQAVLQSKKSLLLNKQSGLNNLQKKLEALQLKAKEFDNLSSTLLGKAENEELLRYKATVSDTDILTFTPNEIAPVGSYTIEVKELASASRLGHSGVADKTAALSAQDAKLVLALGGTTHEIAIEGGKTSLADVQTAIGKLNTGIQAKIINTGSGANPYRLVIGSAKTGTANSVSIDPATTLAGFGNADFAVIQQATDAEVVIDGVSVIRSENSISDALDGVTLDLKKKTEAGKNVTAKIDLDDAAVKSKVEGFVASFNDVLSFLKAQSYDKERKTAGPLSGDAVVLSMQSRLRAMISSPVTNAAGDSISLSDVGLKTTENGTLSLDSSKFTATLRDKPDNIKALFSGDDGITGMMGKFLQPFLEPTHGVLKSRTDAISKNVTTMDTQMATIDRRLEKRQATLLSQFTAMEKALAGLQTTQDLLYQQMAI